jgi:hypothetical protein
LGLREQSAFMKLWWPDFATSVRSGKLTAVGDLVPSPLSATYTVRIALQGGGRPEVRVVSPELKARDDGGQIPHMYGQERLCLYLPWAGQWTAEKPIAVTIVPWASMWLYFYEVWRATGEWLGGGVEPGENETEDMGGGDA